MEDFKNNECLYKIHLTLVLLVPDLSLIMKTHIYIYPFSLKYDEGTWG